jgi:hypothetical protein
MKLERRGRPVKYTKFLVEKLLKGAQASGEDFKTHVLRNFMAARLAHTPKKANLIYGAIWTAAKRYGLIEVKSYKKRKK